MKRQILRFIFAATLVPQFAYAQVTYEKLLLPIAPTRVAGAFGTDWLTNLTLTNVSDVPVEVQGYFGVECMTANCPNPYPQPPLPPRATIVIVRTLEHPNNRGVFLRVEAGRLGDLSGSLRTRDLSRQEQTWGTTIPLVTDADLLTKFSLTNVPTTPEFRATLRLYDAEPLTSPEVAVRVYRIDPGRRSAENGRPDERLIELFPQFGVPATPFDQYWFPAFAEIPLWLDPRLAGVGQIRIEVQALDGRREYWGFVTVTHNQTQHVTVVAPR